MVFRAEIISIGDELTTGQRLDTNSRWLSEQLGNLGVKTAFHTTVGDSMADNIDAFRTAAGRAELVVATGGLGPTADDLTREAMAVAFSQPLEVHPEALAHIESLFAMRKRPMPERNRVQAMFPRGARIIDNPHGTAPGIDLSAPTSRIFSLPGVPAEMMQMFSATVEPRLIHEMGVGKRRWFFHALKVFGIGESDVEKLLPDLIHRDRDPLVGITVSKATITLRVAALCSDEQEFQTKIKPTLDEIRKELGQLVFGEGESDIDDATHRLLSAKGLRLAVVEVGAGSWIQHGLAKLAPSENGPLVTSAWFPNLETLSASVGTVKGDEPLQKAAEHFLLVNDADLCLVAGVYPTWDAISSSKSLPTSEFSFALARRGEPTKQTKVSLGAHPDVLYHRLAKAGLNFLRLELLQHG